MNSYYSILTYDKSNMVFTPCRNLDELLDQVTPERVNWITLSGITAAENHADVERLLHQFHLSPLLINRIFDLEQQQFEGEYEDCLYLEYAVLPYRPENGKHIEARGSLILGGHFLILLEKTPAGLFEKVRSRILSKHTLAQRYGVDYLLYLLIKAIVLNYQHIIKELIEKFEELEDEVIDNPAKEYVYDKILELRGELKPLFKHLARLDDFVEALRDEDTRFITGATKKHFTKTLDREADDLLDGYMYLRSWVAELIEIHRANLNESTNRVIQRLTIIATIFLPLSFIAGVYGMNFEYMPELSWRWAYPAVLMLMGGLGVGLLLVMRHKRWL